MSYGSIGDDSYEGFPSQAFIFKLTENLNFYTSWLSRENGCTIRPVCVSK